MKAKVKATGEIVEVERITNGLYGRTDEIAMLYRKDGLDFDLDPPQPEVTIRGWVTRDDDNKLNFHMDKPNRADFGRWSYSPYPLPTTLFPSLTWQDEPIEVEITIKPLKIKDEYTIDNNNHISCP